MDDERGGNALISTLAHPQVLNPLAAYSDAAQVANRVWANRQNQANQAAGQAYQGAIDEQGNFDPVKFRQNLVATGPTGALAAQSGVESAQKLAGEQILQGDAARKVINNELSTVMTLPDDQIGQGIAGAAARLRAAGIPEAVIHQTLLNMPNDAAGQRQYLNQLRLQLAPPDQVQENIPGYGKLGTITAPGGVQMGTVQDVHGGVFVPPQPGARGGLTPLEGAHPTQIGVTPGGAPIMAPLRSTPFAPPGEGGGQLGGGRYPSNPALRAPGAGGDTAAPAGGAAPQPAPGGGIVTDLGPGQKAALETGATQSAGAFKTISDQSVAARSQGSIIDNMLADTSGFVTGPGTEGSKKFQAAFQAWAPGIARAFGVDPDKLAKIESFDKLAAQIQDAQGAGSDARLAVIQAATPNTSMTPAGVDLILRQLRGNADYLQARATLAATWPDKSDVTGFEATAGKNIDPRAFQYARMTGAQKRDYLKSVKDPQAVMKAYNWAENRGLLNGQ